MGHRLASSCLQRLDQQQLRVAAAWFEQTYHVRASPLFLLLLLALLPCIGSIGCGLKPVQANKVPQERVPADVAAKITQEMLEAFKAVLGPAGAVQLPKPVFTRCVIDVG